MLRKAFLAGPLLLLIAGIAVVISQRDRRDPDEPGGYVDEANFADILTAVADGDAIVISTEIVLPD